jgi:hypothetical protein
LTRRPRGTPRSAAWRFAGALAVAGVAAAGLAACDGDNLFSGPARIQTPPTVTAIVAPDQVAPGQLFDIQVRAVAPRALRRVTVNYRRAVVGERILESAPRTDTVSFQFTLQMPVSPLDSILVIDAFATDVFGTVGATATRSVRIVQPVPGVTVATDPGPR